MEKIPTGKLIIVRGIPGTGKSTFAKEVLQKKYNNSIVLEADMYFMQSGRYNFDGKQLERAHDWCKLSTNIFLKQYEVVIVCNTFVEEWTMYDYILRMNWKDLVVIDLTKEYSNVHNVPTLYLDNMRRNFLPFFSTEYFQKIKFDQELIGGNCWYSSSSEERKAYFKKG